MRQTWKNRPSDIERRIQPVSIRRHTLTVTPLGELCLAACDDRLSGVYFPDHQPPPAPENLGVWVSPADSVFIRAADQLHAYFAGERADFDLDLELPEHGFTTDVWRALTRIPYGHTRSYSDIAVEVGRASAARAVGTAVAHNPLSIVIPCHRVVLASGGLSGYAGGVERKRWLLDLERTSGLADPHVTGTPTSLAPTIFDR